MSEPVLICPNCKESFIMEKLNCGIFRHAIFIANAEQINPHASKEECEYYINNKLIYGCGRPFRIKMINNQYETELCNYI